MLDFIGLYLYIAGFVIGLGAVTVIDIHGFLGRKSSYWTAATIRTHKVTKPLIWLGLALALGGAAIYLRNDSFEGWLITQVLIATALILNGCFLSFWVSPRLLKREQEGRAEELLPGSWQRLIAASFVISFVGWWGSLGLLVLHLTKSYA